MKKSFLYAYDRQNLGDDLFVHTIARRYPETQFYMWSSRENRKTFACLPNLKVIDKDSRFVRLLHRLRPSLVSRYKGRLERRCDAVVYIGGSIFIEYPNWEQICTWWEWTAEHRPFYVLGANFGPYHTERYRQKMAQIFGKMQDVCFRDKYSHNLFCEVNTVRVAPDILFSYPMPKVPVKEKQVFVSVIDCAGRDESHGLANADKSYVENMAKMIRGCLEDGCSIVLSSFCKEEGDETGIAKILAAMDLNGDEKLRTLAYDGTNAIELTEAIAASEYVIATRFHGTVLAMAAGRPVLPVVYSDKTLHMLHDIGFAGMVLDIRDENNADYTVLCGNRGTVAQTADACSEAEAHFQKLDTVLKK